MHLNFFKVLLIKSRKIYKHLLRVTSHDYPKLVNQHKMQLHQQCTQTKDHGRHSYAFVDITLLSLDSLLTVSHYCGILNKLLHYSIVA